ncbi:acyltransferase [Companilactobacillus mishanensis]|uniref:acyltransferase n=1 Tax=Companilactobacillus mishanensis TaxID=2486008 RepID=UPI001295F4F3|nr:acyltransferase [Companilactobacillus mishanensis]MQS89892.1 acyltransferase [Companilactobacillus mishanensis]
MTNKRIVYIDYLKILAMLGVVMSHSLAQGLNKDMFSFNWHVGNFFLGLVSPAVGIFFMVSGALILSSPRTYDLKYLFSHRIVRLIVPFLIWSAISITVFMYMDGNASLWFLVNKMLLLYHQMPIIAFWFLYPLIGFYLLSPILKIIVDRTDTKILDYAIILWFVTNMLLPFIAAMLPKEIGVYFKASSVSNFFMLGQSLGYFLLGYRLTLAPIHKNTLHLNVIATTLLLLITVILNFENNLYHINIPVIGYVPSVFAMLFAMEIFLTFRKIDFYHQISRLKRHYFTLLSKMSYGVYLTHGIVVEVLNRVLKIDGFFWVFLITSVVCILFTYIVSRIPKVRFILFGMD